MSAHLRETWGRLVTAEQLPWAGLISVAEQTMERAGQVGRRWDLPNDRDFIFEDPKYGPTSGRYNPEYKALIKPVEQFVSQVVGFDMTGSVRYSEWDMNEAGNPLGMTDSMGNITVQLQTHDMTILHECAHVITRTREGDGHDEDFARLLYDLYAKHISPEAADTFWGVIDITGRVASTWRGFSADEGSPFWMQHDAVIATQMRGRDRYYEAWVEGRNYVNRPTLEQAQSAVEAKVGKSLTWTEREMPKVNVLHYYFGWTDEFTDPLTIYYADF